MKVVHCKKDTYDVYIGRGKCPNTGETNGWGNPFEIGKHGNRESVIAQYWTHILSRSDLISRAKKELKGKSLGCWCAPNACHGDILSEIANKDDQ